MRTCSQVYVGRWELLDPLGCAYYLKRANFEWRINLEVMRPRSTIAAMQVAMKQTLENNT